ncbi:TRAP-type C4-dicarboxylate transport system, small permease component [Sphaerochaeta associata]|uniref:TRAP transporter small permease n=1 Tax=Sphaerochaeta associata TaxID=1129264 RepID=A0ABY4DBI5_9SPIR|nr:TRAP transporter small permease [Sphaerochaeta associata]UOM51633.1 TRAP transporter small permease [Sphaerochaeta associata]SMP52585.1 TRAP-type C4-dicarboxylate transport system, small permease component [Sphaerochaeta associata]
MLTSLSAGLQTVSRYLYTVLELLAKLIFVIMVVSVSIAVVGRFVFSKSPSWTEEVGILSLVWLCFLTAAMGIRDGSHMRMTIIEYIFSPKVCNVMHRIAYVVLLVLYMLFIKIGLDAILMMSKSILPSTKLPLSVMYGSVFVSGILGLVMALAKLFDKESFKL